MNYNFKLITNNLSLLTLFNLLLLQGFAQDKPDINTVKKIALSEKRAFKARSVNSSSTIGYNYDLKYHRFDLYIDPDTFYIKGSVKSIFLATQDNVSQISFELNDTLTVDSVKTGNVKLAFSHIANNELEITLNTVLRLSQEDSVTVYYHGVPYNNEGYGSFSKGFHGTLPKVPIIWSLSEPYGAKDWWPCKSSLNDKIDSIDMFITTPGQFRAASNGLLVSETIKGADKTYHWKHRYPIAAYLIAVGVTNYAVYSQYVPPLNGKQLLVLNYIYPEDSAADHNATEESVEFIQFYNKLFIPYPFYKEKYGHAEFGWGGGMEHQTMSFLGAGAFGFDIISHELAHQWFGDMITLGDWHQLWLNEGFATYCSGLCYEHFTQTSVPDWWSLWKHNEHEYVISKPCGSVYAKDTADIDSLFDSRLTYSKAALLLHQLRWVIGDSNFFHALRDYLNDPKLAYNYAFTPALIAHFESASGMDLTQYFNDWYTGEGFPIYNIKAVQDWKNNIMLTLNQRQSCNSVSFFNLPVPIEFKNSTRDTIITFNNTFSGQTFNINPGFHADSIKFDPQLWLIASLDTLSVINAISEKFSQSQIGVYPNPVNDICYVNYLDVNITKTELIDSSGKILFVVNPKVSVPAGQFTIDMNPFKQGLYVLKIYSDKGTVVRKIIKER